MPMVDLSSRCRARVGKPHNCCVTLSRPHAVSVSVRTLGQRQTELALSDQLKLSDSNEGRERSDSGKSKQGLKARTQRGLLD